MKQFFIGSIMLMLLCFSTTQFTSAQTISISGSHGMAFCGDSLWSWGNLIDSTYMVPTQVSIPAGQKFIKVNALSGSSFALDTAGYVWSWGSNTSGQLGIGNTSQTLTPGRVHGFSNIGFLQNITAIAGRSKSAFALASDSTIWSWGSNTTGVLGDGTYFNTRTTPVHVIDFNGDVLDSIVQVSSSSEHSLALDENGNVWAWGRNYYGETGQGLTNNYQLSAIKVKDQTGFNFFSNAKQVAAGVTFSLILKNDGTVWAFGNNEFGQLGINTTNNINLPEQVYDTTTGQHLSNIISIVAAEDFAMALSANGKVYVWGSNLYGELTNEFNGSYSMLPVLIHSLPSVANIFGAVYTACVETTDGEIVMWGSNLTSNLGNNQNSGFVPVLKHVLNENALPMLTNVKQLSVGYDNQVIVKTDGSIWTWGDHSVNVYNPNNDASLVPNRIYDSTGLAWQNGIKQVAAGSMHQLALTNSGHVYGWGSTSNYVLGNPPSTNYYHTYAIRDYYNNIVNNVRTIAAGSSCSMFLHNDSTVSWCGWLYLNSLNSYSRPYPSKMLDSSDVDTLHGVVAVAASLNNMYAVTADGKLWVNGNNDYGQLGIGDNSVNWGTRLVLDNTGTQPLTNIVSVSCKQNSVFALCADGTVWAWGNNHNGQLGVGDTTFSYLKRKVLDSSGTAPLQNVKAIAMGVRHAIALMPDSTAWAWGLNGLGEVCDLTRTQRLLPVRVLNEDSTLLHNIISVHAGEFLTSVLLSDKTVLSCGYNWNGETGTRPTLGEDVPQLTQLACHSFAPIAGFSAAENNACINDCIQFTDTSAHFPSSWHWEIPGANPAVSSDQNPVVCFPQAGTYSVTLTTSNFMGDDSTSQTGYITIGNNPTAAFSFTLDTTTNQITTTNSSAFATSYSWTFGDGGNSSAATPTHTYTTFGDFIICLTAINQCGNNTTCDTVTLINNDTTGISFNGYTKNELIIYPNPSADQITIQLTNNSPFQYEITNMLGEMILKGSNENQIDISELATDLYFISIIQNEKRYRMKFIKQ